MTNYPPTPPPFSHSRKLVAPLNLSQYWFCPRSVPISRIILLTLSRSSRRDGFLPSARWRSFSTASSQLKNQKLHNELAQKFNSSYLPSGFSRKLFGGCFRPVTRLVSRLVTRILSCFVSWVRESFYEISLAWWAHALHLPYESTLSSRLVCLLWLCANLLVFAFHSAPWKRYERRDWAWSLWII